MGTDSTEEATLPPDDCSPAPPKAVAPSLRRHWSAALQRRGSRAGPGCGPDAMGKGRRAAPRSRG